jgi:hypothetical protein
MTSSEQQRLEEERLQAEIVELRSDLGETVEALVHKADLPARAKERGNELKEEAIERGIELQEQVVDRTVELSGRAIERGNEWKAQIVERGSELRDRAIDAAERTREAVSQTPTDRWVKLAAAGITVITVLVIVRRVRRS